MHPEYLRRWPLLEDYILIIKMLTGADDTRFGRMPEGLWSFRNSVASVMHKEAATCVWLQLKIQYFKKRF